ncbi:MAG: acyltransferase family protein [Verrucomicrobiia bacterium]
MSPSETILVSTPGPPPGVGRLSARMPQLDGLRTLAVATVAWLHWMPEAGFQCAWFGVQLFFVLSGFLITGILLDSRSAMESHSVKGGWVCLRSFFMRRFLRIFPLFYVTLAATYFLDMAGVRESWGWHAAYLSNYFFFVRNEWLGYTSHFWALAVEQQFYIFWPFLILFLPKRLLLPLILASIALAPLCRMTVVSLWPDIRMAHILTPSCFDSVGVGALIAYAVRNLAQVELKACSKPFLGVGLVGTVAFFIYGHKLGVFAQWGVTFTAMALGSLVFAAAGGIPGKVGLFLRSGPMMYLGQISYALYVFHPFADPGLRIALRRLHLPQVIWTDPSLRLLSLTTMTILGAALSWHLLEKPFNNLKRYFPYT